MVCVFILIVVWNVWIVILLWFVIRIFWNMYIFVSLMCSVFDVYGVGLSVFLV